MKRNSDWFLITLFSGGFILGPISLDALMPALPALAQHFGTTTGGIQVSFGIYFAGFAAGQLINGPLADRFGRKPVLVGGLIIFVMTPVGSLLAPDMTVFLIVRFVQGFAANAGAMMGKTVARDLFEREHAARLMSYFFGFGAIGPIVGPAIGGWMVETVGFQAIFLLMVGFGVILLVFSAFGFRETIPARNPQALNPMIIGIQFARFMKNREFLAYTACSTLSALGIFAYINASAPVMIDMLGVRPAEFGVLISITMAGFMAGGLISGRVVRRVGLDRMILIGGLIIAAASLMILITAVTGDLDVPIMVVGYALYLLGHAAVGPQATAGALTPFPDAAGTASTLTGFIMVAVGSMANVALGLIADGTALPMAIATAIGGVGTLLTYVVFVRPVRRRREAAASR